MKALLSIKSARPVALLALVLGSSALVACGGAQGRVAAAEKIPAQGQESDKTSNELPVVELDRGAVAKAEANVIRPACDARVSPPVADAKTLLAAKEVVGTWMQFKKDHPKAPRHGIKTNGTQDPTLQVDSFGMTCGAAKNTVEVNGTEYPFDVAWVLTGKGASITDGIEDAGRYAMVQALSFKDRRMIVVKVFFPSDANRETDDVFVVGNLDNFAPDSKIDPLVHNVGEADKPQLETIVLDRQSNAKEGFYYVAPKQNDRTRARYMGVGRVKMKAE